MSKLLCFDYGHGGSDGGADYKGRKESNEVLSLGKEVASEVRRHGVTVDETRTTDTTVSLDARSNYENKKNYDYFVSFHRNAFLPEQANGVETFTYLNGSAKAKNLANSVQNNLVSVGFFNRKVKEANFHVLRETKAAAILIEIGFIDNTNDNKIFDAKRNEIIKAITKGILSQLEIAYIDKTIIAPVKIVVAEKPFIVPTDNLTPPTNEKITLLNGGGWVENAADGRIILHQSRSVYVAFTKDGHLDLTVNGIHTRIK